MSFKTTFNTWFKQINCLWIRLPTHDLLPGGINNKDTCTKEHDDNDKKGGNNDDDGDDNDNDDDDDFDVIVTWF